MIIIGYQGVGKSTYTRNNDNTIDLESSNFWFKDDDGKRKRYFNWGEIYANIAIDLHSQNNIVFTSSHAVVTDQFKNRKDLNPNDVAILIPSINLKDEWIKKLEIRYNESGLNKDYKAWKNAECGYEANIEELVDNAVRNGWDIIIIDNIDYSLSNILNNYFDTH